MYVDKNGRSIKIGDKVKRVNGGEHGGMYEGDIGIVCTWSTFNTKSMHLESRGTFGYDPKNFEVITNKVNHLPDWL